MKERWLYSDYEDCETQKPVYYRKKQLLTWQFYLRFIKEWFTPCSKCQEKLEKEWFGNDENDIIKNWQAWILFAKQILEEDYIVVAFRCICDRCIMRIKKKFKNSKIIIIGNKEYEPPFELQRHWVDVEEKNKNGVYETVMENVTKKEYYKVKGWKL